MARRKQTAAAETVTAEARSIVFVGKSADEIVSNRRELEDDYTSYYQLQTEMGLIKPPYCPRRLEELVQTNNTLGPCVDAMVTNCDGTGWEIERSDGAKMDDAGKDSAAQPAIDFFNECAPMMSFRTLRQRLRRDIESIGWGFLEVIRNVAGDVVFCGPLEGKMMRIGRLMGPAVPVEVTMKRGGKDVTFTQYKRERKFAQKIGPDLIWFKEFGASQDLDKYTGKWGQKGSVPANRMATEVLYFTLDPDIQTPYGVPRWINQTPSVIGSRQAEEHNLEFFQNGGIPPYLVIVQGGQLAEKTVESVREALNQKGAHARVQVIEAFSTSGSIDGSSNVQVKVERFGAEKANDAMFQQYDKDCENRIRRSFRIPEILIGKTESMNFATAQASYLVAEAQVFKPERDEFDEIITTTLLPALLGGSREYVFRSKPISIIDAATQLSVITAANATGLVDKESMLTTLNEIGGMDLQAVDVSKVPDATHFAKDPAGNVIPLPLPPPLDPNKAPPKATANKPAAKKSEDETAPLRELLGCTLAVMQAQDRLAG